MSELNTYFQKVGCDPSGLLHHIEIDDLTLPEIQRPFIAR